MRKTERCMLWVLLLFAMCNNRVTAQEFRTISPDILKDKIAGGWAGKMIGVTYGAPTEFQAAGHTFDDPILWTPEKIKESKWQDDIYVQLTFLMTMDQYGMDTPAKKYQEMFAKAGYPLWHANVQARKNYFDSIFPPYSGNPENNMHADDIDFQIESDYIGFMCPGMPQTAVKMAGPIGHIMNYGDGVYGGAFVAALYCEAFFETDIPTIIGHAAQSLPQKSAYYAIIQDVLQYYKQDPSNWKAAWNAIEAEWGKVDICCAGQDVSIDATLNGAYIAIGLLYGKGDPMKTLEISTRCGQDSDCNPSNAMAVLGVIKGFRGLPENMQKGVVDVGNQLFDHTTYSFNSAVKSTYEYSLKVIAKEGGKISGSQLSVKCQNPKPLPLEVSFPGIKYEKTVWALDAKDWKYTGDWKIYETTDSQKNTRKQSMVAEKAGDAVEFTFDGTGLSIEGNWYKDGGKADVYVDGKLHRNIDTYFHYAGQQHESISIWHVLNLKPGNHSVRLVVKGEKKPESEGTRIYLVRALIFAQK